MALIGMQGVSWGFGGTPLLENIDLHIEKGERVCLLGRNGLGKSTVLRLLQGDMTPDTGEVWRNPNTTAAFLEQEVPEIHCGSAFEVVAGGLGRMSEDIAQYRIEALLSRAGLSPDDDFSALSAGMKRRVLFARAAVADPDVLMLDEPTNHLDMAAIAWMEDFILQNVKTLVFVTHDRAFLKRIATRIVELDMGRAVSYPCDYNTYLERRQADLDARERQQAQFDKKLSEEEAWLRQGIKARRTRNEGRVRALLKMREERRNRRNPVGNVTFRVDDTARTGKMVIEAESISCTYGGNPVISGFSTRIVRGDRIGIIGPNGAGKSTLLNLLLKKTAPDTGTVKHGTGLMVASFDQLRETLEEDKTVADNIGHGNNYITVNDRKKHVVSHLKDFLFSPQRSRTPVHILSGGEKNRLLLARLFARPANVLVLDEPTNDLDIETLELLEEMLFHFQGTILLVSHDRAFLNNVVTSTMVLEGSGRIVEYAGGYDDYLLQRQADRSPAKANKPEKPAQTPKPKSKSPEKLSFKEKRELESLYDAIDALETEHGELYARLSDPDLYKNSGDDIAQVKHRLQALEKEIERATHRWETLEAINSREEGPKV